MVLLAGPSGSGKSRLVRVTGAQQLRLDDFYADEDEPGLPMAHGRIDWDDVRTWHTDQAATALDELLRTGRAVVPEYSIALSRRTGSHEVTLAPNQVLVAEGIFAADLLAACRTRGIDVTPVWLDRRPVANFWRRLRRDLKQKRKPPTVLVRRGLMLWRQEGALRRSVVDAGFEPLTMTQALALVERQQRDPAR